MAIIPGTPDPDTLNGTIDADTITGLAGDDTIYASLGDDSVTAGAGNDSVLADFGNDTVYGGDGNDTVWAGGGVDSIYGGAGHDYIVMGDINYGGLTTAFGGADNDTFAFFSTVSGSAAGGAGIDSLMLLNSAGGDLTVDLAGGLVTGTDGFSAVAFSSIERLMVYSYGGDDSILAGDYDDLISVGGGANVVDAKGGNDQVSYAATIANTLDGGDGYDVLTVNSARSSLYFIVGGGAVDDGQLSAITGFEEYIATGARFADIVSFAAGNDAFTGNGGQDTAFGFAGNDSLYGGSSADFLDGGQDADSIVGGIGDDTILGGAGADFLAGGSGSDSVDGGAGDDRIQIYLGNDTVTGGEGSDRFLFTLNQSGFLTITDFEVGVDQLRFTGAFIQNGPPAGPLDPALLSYDTVVGGDAQFVLTYDAGSDTTALTWDTNGDDPSGGVYLYATFLGNIALTAADFLIL